MKRDVTAWLLKNLGAYIRIDEDDSDMLQSTKEKVVEVANVFIRHLFQLLLYDQDYGIDETEYLLRKDAFFQSLNNPEGYCDIYFDELRAIGVEILNSYEFCTKYSEYLLTEWFDHDKMLANVYRFKSGFFFGHSTTNAVESVVNLKKYEVGYCSKSIIDFIQVQEKHASTRYHNFLQFQVRKRLGKNIIRRIGSCIFSKLIAGYVSTYALHAMYDAIGHGVTEYSRNPTAPSYFNTCTLLKVKNASGKVDAGRYIDMIVANQHSLGLPCSCYSHGVYCTEFLVSSYGSDWQQVCVNWDSKGKLKLSKSSCALKQKHISGRFLRRVNMDASESLPYIKNYDDTTDKYQKCRKRKRMIASNSQEESCSSNSQMQIRLRSVLETHRFTLTEQTRNRAFLKSLGMSCDERE